MIFVVGGGGKLKDTDAVLVVTVPTGSTVTATKGGTTLTPTMWVKAADASLDCAIFSIPASKFDSTTPWTVTATLGTQTASDTVLITTNKEYEISLSFALWLFNDGNTFESTTGGYFKVYDTNGSSGTFTLGSTITVRGAASDSNSVCGCSTVNAVDLTGVSTLKIHVTSGISGYSSRYGTFGVSKTSGFAPFTSLSVFTHIFSTGDISINVSNLTGLYYVKIYGASSAGQLVTDKVLGTA